MDVGIRLLLLETTQNLSQPSNTPCLKKTEDTQLVVITLANTNQFSKFFHRQIPKETFYLPVTENSSSVSQLYYYTSLSLGNSKIHKQ